MLKALNFSLLMPKPVGQRTPHLGTFVQMLLSLCAAGMLSMSFLDPDKYAIAWFAIVPLLVAINGASLLRSYLIGLLTGVVLYSLATYWVLDFLRISKAYDLSARLALASLYWLYSGHLLALICLLFQWMKNTTKIHEFVLFPVTCTALVAIYPTISPMRLGDTQAHFLLALQAIDLLGVHGLSALIVLVNIMFYRGLQVVSNLLTQPRSNTRVNWASCVAWGLSSGLIIAWFCYGVMQLSKWDEREKNWSTLAVGIVQPNEIPSLAKMQSYPGYSRSYPPELDMTERLVAQGAKIVIWAEGQTKGYFDDARVNDSYHSHAKSLGVELLLHDMRNQYSTEGSKLIGQFSSVAMINSRGEQAGVYDKNIRIPFGEYAPFAPQGSYLRRLLEAIFGDFLVVLNAGDEQHTFDYQGIKLMPLICFETIFPEFAATGLRAIAGQSGEYRGGILVALSNDGWFGSTHQPYQHIVPSVLRAIENRMPFVHAVNNGPSLVVAPSGRTIFKSDFQRAGGYLVQVPYSPDAKGSFYTRYPNLVPYGLYVLLILGFLAALFCRDKHFT